MHMPGYRYRTYDPSGFKGQGQAGDGTRGRAIAFVFLLFVLVTLQSIGGVHASL